MTHIRNAYSVALLVALMASGIAAARVRPTLTNNEATALDSEASTACPNSLRRRRADNMCSCRRRSTNSDLPSGYTCSGNKIEQENSTSPHVQTTISSNYTDNKCDHCHPISSELWEERSVCYLTCGQTVYFQQSLALYSSITAQYEKIGIYKIRLDVETDPIKTMWPLKFEYKFAVKTNRDKVLVKFYEAEKDYISQHIHYTEHCIMSDCDWYTEENTAAGRASCRDERSEHSVSFKIDEHRKPQMVGFDVTWIGG